MRPTALTTAPGLTTGDNIILDHPTLGTRRLTSAALRRSLADRAGVAAIVNRRARVNGGAYLTPATGTGSHGSTSDTQAILLGNRTRAARDMAVVDAVQFWFKDKTSVTRFQVDVWRRLASSNWMLVGSSENLINQIKANSLNTISLVRPIRDVRRGDWIGWGFSSSAAVFPLVPAVTTSHATTVVKTASSPADDMWLSGTTNIANAAVPIRLLGSPPDAVAIGDSLTAGSPGTRSLAEAAVSPYFDTFSPGDQYSYTLENALGIQIQNMGISSQVSSQVAARFTTDVVDLKPRMVFLWVGTNNIGSEWPDFDQSAFLADMTGMVDAALAANIFPVVLGIPPRGDWCNETYRNAHNQRRSANAALEALCASTYYGRSLYVDLDEALGEEDSGGPAGNLDKLRSVYSADTIHMNAAGYAVVGATVAAAIAAELV